jgi:DNA-binding NtrC family response regulator
MSRMVVVHLEDDLSLQNILSAQMAHVTANVELGQFETGERLLETLERHHAPHVDCFLIDIRLSGQLDGCAVAEAIRKMGYNAPIIITSAFDVLAQEWLEEWNCDWVEKPIDVARLQNAILPQVDRYHQQVLAENRVTRRKNG